MTDRTITHTMPDVKCIACLGDSITAGYFDEEGLGWTARLRRLFSQRQPLQYHVQSCGISGDTVVDAWHNLRSQVSQINPDILIIKIGVNDLSIREGMEPESTQISRAKSLITWRNILPFVKRNFGTALVVAPLPIAQDIIRFAPWPDNPKEITGTRFEQRDVEIYNRDIESLCKEFDVPFLGLFDKWVGEGHLDDLFPDGLHPNAKGHEKLAKDIFEKLKEIGL